MYERNKGHQRIDDVSTDLISYGIESLETKSYWFRIGT